MLNNGQDGGAPEKIWRSGLRERACDGRAAGRGGLLRKRIL